MPLNFDPPVLNSASPWATSFEDLQSLYRCTSTGAVTTRTSLLSGFEHDPSVHQHCFIDTGNGSKFLQQSASPKDEPSADTSHGSITSLNTYGYSPHPLSQYLQWATEIIVSNHHEQTTAKSKPFIFSVTGTADEVAHCHNQIVEHLHNLLDCGFQARFLMEINLSCPNIHGKPPPAYSKDLLSEYLTPLSNPERRKDREIVPIGMKTPPYTYTTQFTDLISALLSTCTTTQERSINPDSNREGTAGTCPISFITATNTLGSSLLLTPTTPPNSADKASDLPPIPNEDNIDHSASYRPTLSSASGTGIGGLAGAALHPLALGNVSTIRRMLDEHLKLHVVKIIGVGGVSDRAGYERMRSVGAAAVGVGTALGHEGAGVFESILRGRKEAIG